MNNIIIKTLIAFAVITGVLAFIAYKIHLNGQSITRINDEILRSYTIISANKDISSHAKDMVLSTRGFLLTEDSSYLKPYLTALSRYPVSMETLKQNTATRSDSIKRNVEILEDLMTKRHQYSESYVITRQEKGLKAAIDLFKSRNNGNRMMDSIRTTTKNIENMEVDSLENLLDNRENQVKEMTNLLLVLISVIFITLILVLIIISRDITGRVKAEKGLKELNQTLEQQVQARTEDLKRSFEDMEVKVKFRNLELEKQNLALNKRIAELEK